MDQMRQYESTKYQKACIVIAGDAMEDWKYLFRELKMRVGVSVRPNPSTVDHPKKNHSWLPISVPRSFVALRLSIFFRSSIKGRT